MSDYPAVINAAGKLTALGGSILSDKVVTATANAAVAHADLAALRELTGHRIAALTGSEAACVTTGAAAGITISVAAVLCAEEPDRLTQLPLIEDTRYVLVQAGHAINFGADITQMIALAGARPLIAGSREGVLASDTHAAIEGKGSDEVAAFLYVQSHHCVQENMVELADFIALGRQYGKPVIVDAAAEEDLTLYIEAGADLVTYSGGKAFCGPTSGFICSRADLVALCEQQFRGIARTMKVGKEQLAGLLQAMQDYVQRDEAAEKGRLEDINALFIKSLKDSKVFAVSEKPDEAGRAFSRIAIEAQQQGDKPAFGIRDLARFLAASAPSIRTRNHHLPSGILLIDARELKPGDDEFILTRLQVFESEQ